MRASSRRRHSGRPRSEPAVVIAGKRERSEVKTANSPFGVTWKSAVFADLGLLYRVEHQRVFGAERGDEARRLAGSGEVEVGLVCDAVGGAVEHLGGEEVDRAGFGGDPAAAADRDDAAVHFGAPTVFQWVPLGLRRVRRRRCCRLPSLPVEIRVRVAPASETSA